MKISLAVLGLFLLTLSTFQASTSACNIAFIFDSSVKVCQLWRTGSVAPIPFFNAISYCKSIDKGFDVFLNTFNPSTDLTCQFLPQLCINCVDKTSISSNTTSITGVGGTATSG